MISKLMPLAGKGTKSLCNPMSIGFSGPFGLKPPEANTLKMGVLPIFLIFTLTSCGQVLNLQRATSDVAELEPGNYDLDPDHAVLLWKINHLGFSTFVGRFETFDASLTFDPKNPQAANLDVLIDTSTIDSGVDALDEQLTGANFFESALFPQARFQSQGIEIESETEGSVTGDLTIKGITQKATFDVTFQGTGTDFLRGNAQILGFEATTTFNRSDFGMTYLIPAVGDEVTLEVHLEFIKNPG